MELSKTPLHDPFSDFVETILNKYQGVVDKYLDKFGKNSLDRVILPDPFDTTIGGYLEMMEGLEEAIEQGVPLEQLTEEEWKTMVF